MGSDRLRIAAPRRIGHEPAHATLRGDPAAEAVLVTGVLRGALRSVEGLRALQRSAGNAATAWVVQRDYEMREHIGHTPSAPYTEIHFRFDTDTLPAWPHEFLHITVQNGDRTRIVHFYYDSWASTWRRPGPVNPLGGDLAAVQAIAITWGEEKAKKFGTQFRAPVVGPAKATVTSADFFDLGARTPQEIEKQARARAREEQQAKARQLKAEAKRAEEAARRAAQELAKKQRAEQAAREQAAREAAEAKARAREAAIAALAFDMVLAFDLTKADARARATELIDSHEGPGAPAPMSEDALNMYG